MSQLNNITHQVTWAEFGNRKHDPMPAAGTVAPAAFTQPLIRTSGFQLAGIPGSKPPKARLKDTIVVGVSLDPVSWAQDWVFTLPRAKQDDLLNHERGHFSIGALLARDFYYDLLELRKKEYASPNEANSDFDKLRDARNAAFKAIVDKYDVETTHGGVASQQARWDGFFSSARTAIRVPAETGPDGAPLKIRLVDFLRQAGISV